MALDQSLDKEARPKGHLRNESMLKAMPPDILQELARRRLDEIEKARKNLTEEKSRHTGKSRTEFNHNGE